MFSPRKNVYTLRHSQGKLDIPKPRTDYIKRSFSYSGAFLWNSLPESLISVENFSYLKMAIKTLFEQQPRSDSHTAVK